MVQLTVIAVDHPSLGPVDHLSCLTASQLDENLPNERTTLLKGNSRHLPNKRTTSSKSFSQSCRDRSHDSLSQEYFRHDRSMMESTEIMYVNLKDWLVALDVALGHLWSS